MSMSIQDHSPFLRQVESPSYRCWDMLVPLLPLTVYSCVYYGLRPLYVMLVSIVAAMLCELIGCAVRAQKITITDGTAAVTGGVIGLAMSPIAPLWLPALASAFAIWLVKLPFGGRGHNIFNPAAGGLAFATVCFSGVMFTYPDPEHSIVDMTEILTQTSPAALIKAGGTPAYSAMDIALSNFPGPIGSVPIILLACMLYLLVRRVSSGWIVLPFLGTCAAWAALFPRVAGSVGDSVMLEMCAGYLLLAATYLIADPVTAPRHPAARAVYGVMAGIMVMLLRYTGAFEEGACFAVLLCNPFSAALDRGCWRFCHWLRHKRQGVAM